MKINPDELDREIDSARRRMAAAQVAMAEGLEAVERQIRDTVASTEAVVNDVVGSVKGSISESVDSVKRTFDLPYQAGRHPWLVFGGSVLVGYLIGGRKANEVNTVGHNSQIGSLRSAATGAIITALWEIAKRSISARNSRSSDTNNPSQKAMKDKSLNY